MGWHWGKIGDCSRLVEYEETLENCGDAANGTPGSVRTLPRAFLMGGCVHHFWLRDNRRNYPVGMMRTRRVHGEGRMSPRSGPDGSAPAQKWHALVDQLHGNISRFLDGSEQPREHYLWLVVGRSPSDLIADSTALNSESLLYNTSFSSFAVVTSL